MEFRLHDGVGGVGGRGGGMGLLHVEIPTTFMNNLRAKIQKGHSNQAKYS